MTKFLCINFEYESLCLVARIVKSILTLLLYLTLKIDVARVAIICGGMHLRQIFLKMTPL